MCTYATNLDVSSTVRKKRSLNYFLVLVGLLQDSGSFTVRQGSGARLFIRTFFGSLSLWFLAGF
jgi:hypothetical protein